MMGSKHGKNLKSNSIGLRTSLKCHTTRFVWYVFLFSCFLGYGCLESFDPHISSKETGLLVVEGYIQADLGATRITLSRVAPLDQSQGIVPEQNAEVKIESQDGETFLLTETTQGVYISDTLELPTDRRYRISIKRSNGNIYESEFQSVKITPPIDSLHWKWKDQLYIYASAHDVDSKTTYYTWTFQEDWIIRSQYASTLMYDKITGLIVERPGPEMVKMLDCYGTNRSKDIILASSSQLAHDAIEYPIVTVPAASEKIQDRYRVIAYQRTMTEEEYNYIVLMKKNSEQNGSFFDPMPSQLFGNIKNSENPEEVVIGYLGSYTIQRSEIIIDANEIPVAPIQEKCEPVDFANNAENLVQYLSDPKVLIPFELYNENNDPEKPRVIALPAVCLDCRIGGRSNVKPNPDWDW